MSNNKIYEEKEGTADWWGRGEYNFILISSGWTKKN